MTSRWGLLVDRICAGIGKVMWGCMERDGQYKEKEDGRCLILSLKKITM